ncbi:MAG: acyl-CoA dehydrogenase family protein [Haliea sp.]|jgi:alkylation response protein AidB-like acyl-CoA dehydrogenase|nr:acyl-CoA dehydrogenase family protein [Haliea sp.]MDP4789071.1 acyl-CoA dehydrogenase family protein [Haliea sp.]MDP4916637.1 acyl-CoA dehydrogenase family protein [Haliea sp.]MDP5063804.1 acyl-CoA dehydrogenase family protein [Haliea sp.]
MNFEFTEEQGMLRDSVARFVQDSYDFDTRCKIAASDEAMSRANWQTFAELGWLSVPFAETHGGFGGSPVDTMVMMEEFGKGLVLEPYLATVLLFGGLLQRGGSAEQQAELIPKIIEGGCLGAFGYLERQSRHEIADITTTATVQGDQLLLNGEKVVVFNGASADHLIVSARSSGQQSDPEGITLVLVPTDAAGVERTGYRLMDGQQVANITFKDVQVPVANVVGEQGKGYPLMNDVVTLANVALAAEAVGIMGKLNAKTLEYTKTRKQFDVAIGSFQALQHRMVDTFMAYEQVKSLLYRAVCELDGNGDDDDAVACVHALKVLVDRNGKKIFGEAIQLHGGMGITDELDIGHYAKRLMMINTTFGNSDHHQAKFNELRYSA